jgi:hypothetical protein
MTITGSFKKDKLFFDDVYTVLTQREKAAPLVPRVKKALQAFILAPKVQQKKIIKAFGVSTDMTQLTKSAFNVTVEEDNFDLGWEGAFRSVPLTNGDLTWEIYNVTNGIAFQKVEEGGRIEMNGLEGESVFAECDYYGGALGFTDKMIRGRKIPVMLDMAAMFRNSFWTNKANNHYALISAAALNTTAYQGAAAEGQLRRDVQTINLGAYTLANRCKDKGFGDTANMQFVAYVHLLDKARWEAAQLAATNILAPALGNGQKLEYTFRTFYTLNQYITQGSPIIGIPGQKSQRAEAMAPTTYAPGGADPLTLNQFQAVWSIYGAAAADTDQFQQLTLG